MFTKTDSQRSLFDVKNVFPDALPKDDWSYIYRDRIYSLIDEEQFRHLYKEESGRPNKSIKTMISLLIFMGMGRGVAFQYPMRLDWLVATRTTNATGRASIDHTTLFKFYNRRETSDTARKLFEELTFEFAEACGTTLKRQRTDSFFILN